MTLIQTWMTLIGTFNVIAATHKMNCESFPPRWWKDESPVLEDRALVAAKD